VKEPDFIHRFVPAASTNAPSRTLLLLHGTGGDENDLLDLGRAIDPGAALLSPRGNVLENAAPRFFRRLAEGVFDETDVVARARELSAFVEAAASRYKIALPELIAIGYSNGANIAAAMFLLEIAPFRQAILLRAMVPLSDLEPSTRKPGRILISNGRIDPIAQPENGHRLAELLRQTGAEVDLIFQAGGHGLMPEDVAASQQWLAANQP
jgi:phospholipase/carboxylesterase